MKKLLALILALMMTLGVASAFGEDDDPWTYEQILDDNGNVIGFEEYYNGTLLYKEDYTTKCAYKYDSDGNLSYYYFYGYDKETETNKWVVYDEKDNLLYINVFGEDYDLSFNEDGSIYVDSPWGNSIDGVYYDKEAGSWVNADGEKVDAPDLSAYIARAGLKRINTDFTWYGNNTAGVIGISLRDNYPGLTDKWYHVVPVDLTEDGIQYIPMVASNKYYLGNVIVTVNGDDVTVTYDYGGRSWYNIYGKDECLAWFRSVDEITTEFLANPTSDLQFGTAISKENDLKGQDYALLFVCNHLTYSVPFDDMGHAPMEFYANHPRLNDYYSNAKALAEKVEEAYAEAEAAVAAEAESADEVEADAEDEAEEEAVTEAEVETEAETTTEAETESSGN